MLYESKTANVTDAIITPIAVHGNSIRLNMSDKNKRLNVISKGLSMLIVADEILHEPPNSQRLYRTQKRYVY
jgi:hypothetical protein